MPHRLFRLLLCLCLVVQTSTGAWAATAMALPVAPVAAQQVAAPCHATDDHGMDHHGMRDAMPHATPHHATHDAGPPHPHAVAAADAGDHDPASGCSAGHCDCLQHCSQAMAMPAIVVAVIPRAGVRVSPPAGGHGAPSPYRPVRPPIG